MVSPLFRAALAVGSIVSAGSAHAENWVDAKHYSMWVDVDSIGKRADGLTYFAWKDTNPGMTSGPDDAAFDCPTGLYFDAAGIASKQGTNITAHTMIGRLFEFVCQGSR